jgi:serine protease
MLRRLLVPAIAAIYVAALPGGALAADFSRDAVLVKYRPEASQSARAAVLSGSGTGAPQDLPGGAKRVAIKDGGSVRDTLAELRADPRVEYAVPDFKARASFIPNDPGPTGRPGGWQDLQWNFAGPFGVNAPAAWDLANAAGGSGGRGVTVAVLDTGVAYKTVGRFRHAPDLGFRQFIRPYDFVDDDRLPLDEMGHGTHVTGTIAERTNNGLGLTGLSYNVRIMPVRVLDEEGEGFISDIARALRYATRHGADVVNMSFEFGSGIRASEIPDLLSAVRAAHRKGVVIVGASGNEASAAVAYPARAGSVIAVGATTEHGCAAVYSNRGSGLDIVAPGGGEDDSFRDNARDTANCHPELEPGRDIFQQTFTTSVRKFGDPSGYVGTSFAAPHVSATAALLIASKRLGANPSPRAVEQRLKLTARDLGPDGYDRRYGFGLLDAAAALAP